MKDFQEGMAGVPRAAVISNRTSFLWSRQRKLPATPMVGLDREEQETEERTGGEDTEQQSRRLPLGGRIRREAENEKWRWGDEASTTA